MNIKLFVVCENMVPQNWNDFSYRHMGVLRIRKCIVFYGLL